MKCYFHQELDAVSTCKECGKNMCRACYDAGNKGTCADCMVDQMKSKQQEFEKENEKNNEYVKAAIMFFVVGAFVGLGNIKYADSIPEMIFLLLLPAYGFFSLHAGLNVLRATFKRVLSWGVVLIFGWPVLIFLVMSSIVIGCLIAVPMFFAKKREYQTLKQSSIKLD